MKMKNDHITLKFILISIITGSPEWKGGKNSFVIQAIQNHPKVLPHIR